MVLFGFWKGFSLIFHNMLENSDLAKTLKKPRFLQCFVRLELLEICEKSIKNPAKIDARFEKEYKG